MALPEGKQLPYVLQWLGDIQVMIPQLPAILLKDSQSEAQKQLIDELKRCDGPIVRAKIGRSLSLLLSKSDTFSMLEVVTGLLNVLKAKDDGSVTMGARNGAVQCMGMVFESSGHGLKGEAPECCQVIMKVVRQFDRDETRQLALVALSKIVGNIDELSSKVPIKDVTKLGKASLEPYRPPGVIAAGADLLVTCMQMDKHMGVSEYETLLTLALRATEVHDYTSRNAVARLCAEIADNGDADLEDLSFGKMKLVFESKGLHRNATDRINLLIVCMARPNVSRDIRAGAAMGLIQWAKRRGRAYMIRNHVNFVKRIIYAVEWGTETSTDEEFIGVAAYSVLKTVAQEMLGESARENVIQTLREEMERCRGEPSGGSLYVVTTSLRTIVYVTMLMGAIRDDIMNTVSREGKALLTSKIVDVRLMAATAIAAVSSMVPSSISRNLRDCIGQLTTKTAATDYDGRHGLSYGIASLLSAAGRGDFGVPDDLPLQAMEIAENMLTTATQLMATEVGPACQLADAAWAVIAALTTLGPSFTRDHMRKYFRLWKDVFPYVAKESPERIQESSNQAHFNTQTRLGGLLTIQLFVKNNADLLSNEVTGRIYQFIASATVLVSSLGNHNGFLELRGMYRATLYETIVAVKGNVSAEIPLPVLVRLIVADLTNKEGRCVGTNLASEYSLAENHVLTDAYYLHDINEAELYGCLELGYDVGPIREDPAAVIDFISGPGRCGRVIRLPEPLNLRLVNSAIQAFAEIYSFLSQRHRHQLFDHFAAIIDAASRQSNAQVAENVQGNLLCAVVAAAKASISRHKGIGKEAILEAMCNLSLKGLEHPDPSVRVLAAEGLRSVTQVASDSFVSNLVNQIIERLKVDTNAITRSTYCLALGGILRNIMGVVMGSKQIKGIIGILHALASDLVPTVQSWALHALSLTYESAGPSATGYVNDTITLLGSLITSDNHTSPDTWRGIANSLNGVVTAVGPELQAMGDLRNSCVAFANAALDYEDPFVMAAGINCLQKLLLFAPKQIDMPLLIPCMRDCMDGSHNTLTRVSVSCLQHVIKRDYSIVIRVCPDLPQRLLARLSSAQDENLRTDIHDVMLMLTSQDGVHRVNYYIEICRQILSGEITDNALATKKGAAAADKPGADRSDSAAAGGGEDDNDADATFVASGGGGGSKKALQDPQWWVRAFAVDCLNHLISTCAKLSHHTQTSAAATFLSDPHNRRSSMTGDAVTKKDLLLHRIPDLIRLAFSAVSATVDLVSAKGLETLDAVITAFAGTTDSEFGGSILEQNQAQVSAALRPAFDESSNPIITSTACRVCAAWITSGASSDIDGVRRIKGLLVDKLTNVRKDMYTDLNESAAVMFRLALLEAWADIYIAAVTGKVGEDDVLDPPGTKPVISNTSTSKVPSYLNEVIKPHLAELRNHWHAVLRDYAMLRLPVHLWTTFRSGTFFKKPSELVLRHYRHCWIRILHGGCLTLFGRYGGAEDTEEIAATRSKKRDTFYCILGLCVQSLATDRSNQHVHGCLLGLYYVFNPKRLVLHIISTMTDTTAAETPAQTTDLDEIGFPGEIFVEIMSLFHRLLRTQGPVIQMEVMKVLQRFLACHREVDGSGDVDPAVDAEKSQVYAALEVCTCILLRAIPTIDPAFAPGGSDGPSSSAVNNEAAAELSKNVAAIPAFDEAIAVTMDCIARIGALTPSPILPSVLPTLQYLPLMALKADPRTGSSDPSSADRYAAVSLRALAGLARVIAARDTDTIERCRPTMMALCESLLAYAEIREQKKDKGTHRTVIALSGVIATAAPSQQQVLSRNQVDRLMKLVLSVWRSGREGSDDTGTGRSDGMKLIASMVRSTKPLALVAVNEVVPEVLDYAKKSAASLTLPEVQMALAVFDALLHLSAGNAQQIFGCLSLILPAVSALIVDNATPGCPDLAIEYLTRTGTANPQGFKDALATMPAGDREKMQTVIKAKAQTAAVGDRKSSTSGGQAKKKWEDDDDYQGEDVGSEQPKIPLKMDFSKFTAKSS
eukprot:Clim_evm33s225 gene=Clim_evmTU33s225